jgi:hypothetical protein
MHFIVNLFYFVNLFRSIINTCITNILQNSCSILLCSGIDLKGEYMTVSQNDSKCLNYVIGPDGQRLTRNDLPHAGIKRWVIRRKAEVVVAVKGHLITLEEVCDRYGLTTEEFESWVLLVEKFGLQGLRTTRIQNYRAKLST